MEYTIDYFINKFSQIRNKLWQTGALGFESSTKCALGHCGGSTKYSEESKSLSNLFKTYYTLNNISTKEYVTDDMFVWKINDNRSQSLAKGNTPKDRILYVLNFLKNVDKKEVEPKTEYRTVIVEIDTKVKQLTNELVLS